MRYARVTLGELTGLNYPKEVREKAEEILEILKRDNPAPSITGFFEQESPKYRTTPSL